MRLLKRNYNEIYYYYCYYYYYYSLVCLFAQFTQLGSYSGPTILSAFFSVLPLGYHPPCLSFLSLSLELLSLPS